MTSTVTIEKTAQHAPTLMPTFEQWKSFASYLVHHETTLQRRHGAVKILPPTRWVPLLKNPFEIRHIKTYTKQEVVSSIHEPNAFYIKNSEMNKRRLVSFDEFKSLAESDAYRLKDEINANVVDHFWATLTSSSPLSAHDIDGSLFQKRENIFNMSNLPSLLKYYPRTIPGVTYPTLHLGMWGSAVGLHIDDHDLMSFHYLHVGAPRIWFIIHPSSYAKLEELVNELKLFSDLNLSCLSPLQHRSLLLDPSFLYAHAIEFSVIEQKINELVIIFPGMYHFYFNTGFNLCESVRYALPSWLTFQRLSPRLCSCTVSSPTATINRRFFTNEILHRFEQEHLSTSASVCIDLSSDEESSNTTKTSSVPSIQTASVSVQTENVFAGTLNNWLSSTESSTPADWIPSTEQIALDVDSLWNTLQQIPTPAGTDPLPLSTLDYSPASTLLSSSPSQPAKTVDEIYHGLLDVDPAARLSLKMIRNRRCYHCRQKGHLNRHCPYAVRRK